MHVVLLTLHTVSRNPRLGANEELGSSNFQTKCRKCSTRLFSLLWSPVKHWAVFFKPARGLKRGHRVTPVASRQRRNAYGLSCASQLCSCASTGMLRQSAREDWTKYHNNVWFRSAPLVHLACTVRDKGAISHDHPQNTTIDFVHNYSCDSCIA